MFLFAFLLSLFALFLFLYYTRENTVIEDFREPNARYIFWTGGFDSTFRLCQSIINSNRKVIPIYLAGWNVDSIRKDVQRHNKSKELVTMKKILSMIKERGGGRRSDNIGDLVIVQNIPDNSEITREFIRLHDEHGYFGRAINQYERMARFSLLWNIPVEVGLEHCGTGLDKCTRGWRIMEGTDKCRLQMDDLPSGMWTLQNLRFPIVHMTKEDMMKEARRLGFLNVLSETWSCWYPRKDGRACGKCEMCKKRVV